jgi:hypothetical protein
MFDPIAAQLQSLRMALLREQHGAAARLSIHEFVEAVQGLAARIARGGGGLVREPRQGLSCAALARPLLHCRRIGCNGGAFVTDLFERFLPADQPLVRPGRPSPNTATGAP